MISKLLPDEEVPDDTVALFEKFERYLTAGKTNYARADKIVEQLLETCEVGVSVELPGKGKNPPRKLTLVDQFADRNKIWAGRGVNRFTIYSEIVKAQNR